MQVCKYCQTINPNHSAACLACGARDFKHQCDNCGTVFEGSNFCPSCGVRAGSEAKKCPDCGARYFSAACPDCGYMPGRSQNTGYQTFSNTPNPTATQVAPRKNLALWILGWIFIFPVPLTIWALKSPKLTQIQKALIILAGWAAFITIMSTTS